MGSRAWRRLLLPVGLAFASAATPRAEAKPNTTSSFPVHRGITATEFWVGEAAGPDNAFITNTSSAWENNWVANFGGVDDPNRRAGWFPAGFKPQENPFYYALPYNDLNGQGRTKPSAARIPWAGPSVPPGESIVKNRWVRIAVGTKVAYGQWEDVGPFGEDDFRYVFGRRPPTNPINQSAGIDLSPGLEAYLGLTGLNPVDWQFVDQAAVPPGPWRKIVTTRGITP
jgi:hypothetical protein